jgi:hypothetical protein
MQKFNLLKILTISLLLTSSLAFAGSDDHAPIGVMRDHIHKKGEYMISYRYEFMSMEGARSKNDQVSSAEVLNKYMVTPSKMDMKMHMFGIMRGVTNKLTLMAMGSFIKKDMRLSNRANQIIHRETSGFGDVKINTMYEFFNRGQNRMQFNLGVSLPTGGIKEKHQGARLPYPMQLGSGSYEALPGISYSGYQNTYSYGAQINGILRLDKNNIGYRRGNSYNITSWLAKKLSSSFSISSRLNYEITQKITAIDPTLNVMMNPVNNINSSGGKRLDLLLGTNFIFQSGSLKGNRLALEVGAPIHQTLNGTQLENDYKVTLGWQRVF